MIQRERHYKDPRLNAAAEELWSYRQKQFEIRRLKAKSEELRDRYSIGATAYDGIRVQGGARHDKLVKIAIFGAILVYITTFYSKPSAKSRRRKGNENRKKN